ncbi:glycosyltransferase family 2 protein [Candidatus Parcubacteria bacterium]|nr:glycosyltransferase family 2 protein [Candidatus Parcubacteria bacterium]
MNNTISVIIPCRNEEKFIGQCLDSIITQDYPTKNLEILVIDGMSQDRTREIIEKFKIQIIDNPKKIIPCALNIGIKQARGEIIIRMDTNAIYAKNYISKCVSCLQKYKADNVGGVIKTLPKKNTIFAKAITLALSHPFGVGGSHFRAGSKKPRWVDTVYGGCFKKQIFEKIGFFNENLARSQDMEFNLRLKKAGGKILLVPDIISYYYPSSTLTDFFKHNIKDGIWAIYPLKFVKMPFRLRHYIPFIFTSSLLGAGLLAFFFPIFLYLFLLIFSSYFLTNMYFSVKIALRERDLRYLLIMPITFAIRHIGYGLGSILGLIKLLK